MASVLPGRPSGAASQPAGSPSADEKHRDVPSVARKGPLPVIGDKIQDGAKALPRQGIDDVVEHVLLVVHPLEAKPGLGDGEPGLSVFSAQNVGRRREEPPLGCSLSIPL
jgi:hypothetical protein